MQAQHGEHAAPAEKVSDQAGHRSAEQVTGHGARQRAPDRDLPLLGPDEIAGQPQRDRKHATRADAGQNAGRKQQRKRRRDRAENVGEAQQRQADDHQAGLAEHVGDGAQHGLDDGKGEGEDGGEAGGGRDADRKILGHVRQHRIECTGGKACRKGRERNDIERRRHAAGCGHGDVSLIGVPDS